MPYVRLRQQVCLDVDRAELLHVFAAQALATVAQRAQGRRANPDGAALDRLYCASISADPRACAEVARALIADGLPPERLCDVHIPAAARRMGAEWEADDLNFSAVTIGTARLQALLREVVGVGVEANHRVTADGGRGSLLLVVAPGADHTLGALVLANQLRRRGFSVRVSLGEPAEMVVEAMRTTRFDAVFFSACIAASLPYLAGALTAVRSAFAAPPPAVLGGALLALEAPRPSIEGIDLFTNDVDEAFDFCGLTSN